MALEKTGLQAVIEGMGGFRSSAGEINKTYANLSTGSERAASRMSRMGDIAKTAIGFAVGTIAVSAIKSLTSSLGSMITSAAPLRDMEVAFGRLAKSYDINSERMMDAMRNAAKGTIADSDLIASANKALIGSGQELGKEFGEALPRLLEMARASAKATGQDVGFLFESLVLGIKRSSPMIIDNTGLQLKLGEAQESYAKSLGITVEAMSAEQKQIALLNATLEAGVGMVEAMGDEQLTTAELMAQARAQVKNLKDEMGKAFLPVLTKVLKVVVPFTAVLAKKLVPAVAKFSKALERLATRAGRRLAPFIKLFERLPEAFRWLRDGDVDMFLERLWVAIDMTFGDRAADVVRNFAERIRTLADHVFDFIAAARSFAGRIGDVAHAIRNILGGWEFLGLEQLKVSLAELVGPRIAGVITSFVGKILSIKDSLVGLWQKHIYPHLAPIAKGIATWWAELGGETGTLGKIKAGWQTYLVKPLIGVKDLWVKYIASPLDKFWDEHLAGRFGTIGERIGEWWTRMGGVTGILGRIGAGWEKYIAGPLTGFYTAHLQSPLASIGMGISAWWAGLSEGGGIMVKIAAGWNKYISQPLVGFWKEHLAEPFGELETRIGAWAQTIWDFIRVRILEPLGLIAPAVKQTTGAIDEATKELGKEVPKPWYQRMLDAVRDIGKEFDRQRKIPVAKRTGILGLASVLYDELAGILKILKEIALMKWTELLAGLTQIRVKWDDIIGAIKTATERTQDQEAEFGLLEDALGLYEQAYSRANQAILDGLSSQISQMQASRREWDNYRANLLRPITIPISYSVTPPTLPMPGYEDIWPEREYQKGGVVPGPKGLPQWAIVHGQELILSAAAATMLQKQLAVAGRLSAPVISPIQGGGPTTINNYYNYNPQVQASYEEAQSPFSILEDLETLAILHRMN